MRAHGGPCTVAAEAQQHTVDTKLRHSQLKKSIKEGSSPSPALKPTKNIFPAQAQDVPRGRLAPETKSAPKCDLPRNKGWNRVTKGLGCDTGTKVGASQTLNACPPFCIERLAGQREVWSARAKGSNERWFREQGRWGSADTVRAPSQSRKPAQF